MEEKVRQFQIDHSDPPPAFTPLEPTQQLDSNADPQVKQKRVPANKRGGKKRSTAKEQGDRSSALQEKERRRGQGTNTRGGRGKGRGKGSDSQRGKQGERGIVGGSTAESKGRGGRTARPAKGKRGADTSVGVDRQQSNSGKEPPTESVATAGDMNKKGQKRGKVGNDLRRGEDKRKGATPTQQPTSVVAEDSPAAPPTVRTLYPLQAPSSYPTTYNLVGTVSDVS